MPGKSAAPDTTRLTAAALVAVTFIAYSAALTTGFTADDFFILSRLKASNGLQHGLSYFRAGFFEYYRPLAFLTHALDWTVWGAEAFGFHLTNVLLHAGSTVLIWLIGRRLADDRTAAIGALLFGLHPASHEAVYWIAARFDLLATFFTLAALLCLNARTAWSRAAGLCAFALGLLSKESAVALLVIAPAWDVCIEQRDWRTTARRLVPLLLVTAAYMGVRTAGADLAPAGGARGIGKMLMLGLALGAVLASAWWRSHGAASPPAAGSTRRWASALVVALGATAALLMLPATSAPVMEKLGFAAFVAFYSVSPIITPAPNPLWFSPQSPVDAVPGFVALAFVAAALVTWRRSIAARPQVQFLLIFVAAALVPVSSMVGGLRYLYLSSAGVALLGALVIGLLSSWLRRLALAAVAMLLVVSASQILLVGRTWRAASTMTRDGVMLMADSAHPCGQKDVMLLTTPVGIGDVYGNFYYEVFDVLAGCSPRNFTTLLRVVRTDADVAVSHPEPGIVEVRVRNYTGNVLASDDLRHFDHRIEPGSAASISTPAGRLMTFPDGTSQVFRLAMTPEVSAAELFYYSSGRVRPAPRR